MKSPTRNQAAMALAHIAVAAFELRNGGNSKKLSQRIDAMAIIISDHLKFRKSTIRRLAGLPIPSDQRAGGSQP